MVSGVLSLKNATKTTRAQLWVNDESVLDDVGYCVVLALESEFHVAPDRFSLLY